ncbi:ABC transporter permease [Amycolatopsis cihanbeyliensis]|uniref:ABC-2 family transporter n=1 Tax=Amycolatopsis cihanbeyliensis TaxID=1128664 RepID=A0A542DGM9_AMYCI|nr:ABC transporter permease [Amycolatopsis cihanbeyliensis]TQJ02239.1 hypothetical protein FB471_1961 [Amycolatopsis cihanbeyliensis]
MSTSNTRRSWTLVALTSVVGAGVAVVLGFLTFGAQATASPDRVPVAVTAPPPLSPVAEQVAGQGGDRLDWRVGAPAEGRESLADKEVYGVLELSPGPGGPAATVVVSGAVNPSGTQLARQALSGVAQGMTGAPARVETVHPAGQAGRVAPLAISALTWVGCLVACAALTVLAGRGGIRPGAGARLAQWLGTGVLVTAVSAGFLRLWDSALPLGWDVLGFLLLAATGFAAVQLGLLRLLGLRAMAVLGPLYLVAPAVAGQVPELLNPAYRALLWSWTPFRFSTEGLRSLLMGTPGAPDVGTGVWVLGGMLVAGLVVLLWPGGSAREQAEPHAPDRVVQVGVH